MKYPVLNPVLLNVGPVAVHWYGVMYFLGFFVFCLLARWRIRRKLVFCWSMEEVTGLLLYLVVGVMVGGRLGYALFYNFSHFLNNPLWLLRTWEGGMSFHGGLIGSVAAILLFSRKTSRRFLEVTDFIVPLTPIGLGLGRVGNFINAELPGRITDLWVGVHFPVGDGYEEVARHVSSLYQAITDGIVLFILVWWFAGKSRLIGQVSGMFLLGYGGMRFLTEFFRQPDVQKGFILFEWMTTGQLLSVPMIILGVILLFQKRFRV